MWQRFTNAARKVVFYAQEEAQKHGEGYVSTEHLLLGLLREPCKGTELLGAVGAAPDAVRAEVLKILPRSGSVVRTGMTLTPRAKRVIDLAYDEARNHGHNYIGTEHLLAGLVREGQGLAAKVLQKFGVELEQLWQAADGIEAGDSKTPKKGTGGAKRASTARRSVWAQFTEQNRKAVFYAQEEAQRFGSEFVGTEHLLLGLLRMNCGATEVLKSLGCEPAAIRSAAVAQLPQGQAKPPYEKVLSPRAKRSIELARAEAASHRVDYVGTEHLLAGLVREGEGVAAHLLARSGVTADRLPQEAPQVDVVEPKRTDSGPDPRASERWLLRGLLLQPAGDLDRAALLQAIIVFTMLDGSQDANELIQCLGLQPDALRLQLEWALGDSYRQGHAKPGPGFAELLALADAERERLWHGKLRTGHLVLAVLASDSYGKEVLERCGITLAGARDAIKRLYA
jgi:ATP-dependent Clp protease ATP-binding subunit ClpA